MAKKIKRRVNKAILQKRKLFEMDNTNHVIVSNDMLKAKIPNKQKRISYLEALVAEFDRLLAV